ncbi:MAG: hypothetical protein LBK29_03745 [Oscillospiraceae bacterium]|jgi:hypothetical protein|nr:hypothetical protein [Oscillospiraceae bacterium]
MKIKFFSVVFTIFTFLSSGVAQAGNYSTSFFVRPEQFFGISKIGVSIFLGIQNEIAGELVKNMQGDQFFIFSIPPNLETTVECSNGDSKYVGDVKSRQLFASLLSKRYGRSLVFERPLRTFYVCLNDFTDLEVDMVTDLEVDHCDLEFPQITLTDHKQKWEFYLGGVQKTFLVRNSLNRYFLITDGLPLRTINFGIKFEVNDANAASRFNRLPPRWSSWNFTGIAIVDDYDKFSEESTYDILRSIVNEGKIPARNAYDDRDSQGRTFLLP